MQRFLLRDRLKAGLQTNSHVYFQPKSGAARGQTRFSCYFTTLVAAGSFLRWRDGTSLRIQFPGTIYHAMACGNGQQTIFRDDRDCLRSLMGSRRSSTHSALRFSASSACPIHLFFRTPRPNLSRGMQYLVSGCANWFNTHHRRPGHLFQDRFKGGLCTNTQQANSEAET